MAVSLVLYQFTPAMHHLLSHWPWNCHLCILPSHLNSLITCSTFVSAQFTAAQCLNDFEWHSASIYHQMSSSRGAICAYFSRQLKNDVSCCKQVMGPRLIWQKAKTKQTPSHRITHSKANIPVCHNHLVWLSPDQWPFTNIILTQLHAPSGDCWNPCCWYPFPH